MTNKEAIFKLIEYRRRLEKDSTIDAEPFDMAIEALKAQQCAVKAIQKIQNINADDYSEYPDHFKAGMDKAIEIIKQEIKRGTEGMR